jgi:NAD(P)-dependent dehydrogenase (short-subunit alcohol dehydrogenase family)
VADMATQAGVRQLATDVLGALPRLDVLVNNVGGFWNTRHVTADGVEHMFALNHLAPFLLTHLLVDRLVESAPARVVTVSSDAQRLGRIDFADLQGERSWSGQRAYNQSKLANVLFTYELARRLRGTGVTATVLHPGVVRTGFGAEDPGRIQRVITPLMGLMKSPEQGALTPIHLPRRVQRRKSSRAERRGPGHRRGSGRHCRHRPWRRAADCVPPTTVDVLVGPVGHGRRSDVHASPRTPAAIAAFTISPRSQPATRSLRALSADR